MSRAMLILNGQEARRKAVSWVNKAPVNTRVEFKAPKRSIDQNSKLWAALSDVASQVTWHGQRLSASDFKLIFMSALKQEMRLVPNLSNNGFVNLGHSSSDLSKEEFSDLLALILAWGAERGVTFNEPAELETA